MVALRLLKLEVCCHVLCTLQMSKLPALFLNEKIKFLQIEELISRAVELKIESGEFGLKEVFKTIETVKGFVKSLFES